MSMKQFSGDEKGEVIGIGFHITQAAYELRTANNAALAAHYSRYGKIDGRKLNRIALDPSVNSFSAFDPFAAFDAALTGKTQIVRGYTCMRRGKLVTISAYRRKPAVRRVWIGTISMAGTQAMPILMN